MQIFHRIAIAAALALGIPSVRNGQGQRFVLPVDKEVKARAVARHRSEKQAGIDASVKAQQKRDRKNARRIALAAAAIARESGDSV